MTHLAYLQWLLLFAIIPTIVLWVFFYAELIKYPRTFLKCVGQALVVGGVWDLFATRIGIWNFPKGCCIEPRLWYLPWEEWGFLVFVTIYIVTISLVLRKYLGNKK